MYIGIMAAPTTLLTAVDAAVGSLLSGKVGEYSIGAVRYRHQCFVW